MGLPHENCGIARPNTDLNEYRVRDESNLADEGIVVLAETSEAAVLLWEALQPDRKTSICCTTFLRCVRRRAPTVKLNYSNVTKA